VTKGDVLIFLVGHLPRELTAIPLGIFTPDPGSHLLRIGVYNPETRQSQSDELSSSTTSYAWIRVYKLALKLSSSVHN